MLGRRQLGSGGRVDEHHAEAGHHHRGQDQREVDPEDQGPARSRAVGERVLNRWAPADQNTGRAPRRHLTHRGRPGLALRRSALGRGEPTHAAHWQEVVIKPVTVIVILLVAVLIGWLGSRIIRRWIGAAAHKAVAPGRLAAAPSARALTLTALLANMWRGVIGVIAFFVVLGTIGINLTPLLAGATVIGATIGFGAQSMVRDLLAGLPAHHRGPVRHR